VIRSNIDSYGVCSGDLFKNRMKSPKKSSSPVATAALVSPDSNTEEATETAAPEVVQNEEVLTENDGLEGVTIENDGLEGVTIEAGIVEGGAAQDDAEGDGDLAIDSGEDESADESDSEGVLSSVFSLTLDTCCFAARTSQLTIEKTSKTFSIHM
jgi:hypothetical protein